MSKHTFWAGGKPYNVSVKVNACVETVITNGDTQIAFSKEMTDRVINNRVITLFFLGKAMTAEAFKQVESLTAQIKELL